MPSKGPSQGDGSDDRNLPLIFGALPAHIAVVDRAGVILSTNNRWPAAEREMRGAAAATGIRAVIDGREPEFHHEYADDSSTPPRWLRMIVTPFETASAPCALVMHVPTGDRAQAELALREQRQLAAQLESERARLVAAQSVAKVGSWETDLATLSVQWSDETHHIFETDPATFSPTHHEFMAFVHPADRAAVETAFSRSLGEDTPQSIEHRVVLAHGTTKTVEERWRVLRDASGAPVAAIGTCQDITERKQLEQQFLRSQRMESVGTLAGGIAHDLNNVLTPILLGVDLLRDQITGADGLEVLAMVQESAERGADLVKQVLTFARGVDGERASVHIADVVGHLVKVMRDTFPKSIVVHFDPPDDLWTISADRTQVHQVALNLFVNARDAMPSGGDLTVTLANVRLDETYCAMNPESHPGTYVRMTVADTGSGIPADVRDRVFEPFFTTKETGRGTGLGLSTTIAIVKSHGGFITLKSDPGAGTVFDVYLPSSDAGVHPTAPEQVHERLPRGRGQLILIVDDEAPIREVTERVLERFGYRVLLASNGAEAVSAYAQHSGEIALVITDMAMPVMDGAATIIAIRSIDPSARIIASSGLTTYSAANALSTGVDDFMPKPYSTEGLLTAIHNLLGGA